MHKRNTSPVNGKYFLYLGVGIVSAMEIINEFSGEGIEKLRNLK